MRRDLLRAVRELWRTFGCAFDSYRPERHYMRGPGPKCHAKRAGLMAQTASRRRYRRRFRQPARTTHDNRHCPGAAKAPAANLQPQAAEDMRRLCL